MPEDPATAPTVTDPKLLELATAGPAWRCEYCGSDQRATDGACGQCGAKRARPAAPVSPASSTARPAAKTGSGCGAFFLTLLGIGGVGAFLAHERHASGTFDAEVVEGSWKVSAAVERLVWVSDEGFKEQAPPDAVDLKRTGERVHHVDSVPAGLTEETYTVEVPAGTRQRQVSETVSDGESVSSTTERVRCGETCTSGPQSCREVCTPNGNGFATCRQQCEAGPRRCEPKWCNETKTQRTPKSKVVVREVDEPVTRTETRTHLVQAYRDVPRKQPVYSWKVKRWRAVDAFERHGTGFEPEPVPTPAGPEERVKVEAFGWVVFKRAWWWPLGEQQWNYSTRSVDELASLGQRRRVRLTVDGPAIVAVE